MGKFKESVVEYEEALKFSPSSGWVRGNLANSLKALGDVKRAEREYLEALKQDDVVTRTNYAGLLAEQGRYPEARFQLDQAIKKEPNYYGIYERMGLIDREQKNHRQAAESFGKAFELLNPAERKYHAHLLRYAGDSLEACSEVERAIQAWRKFLDLDPSDKHAHEIYQKILRYENRDRPIRVRGWVKWFDDARGYGFIIERGSNRDIFVHYSDIQTPGYKTLSAGQEVEFEVGVGPKGRKAVKVTVVKPEE